MHGVAISLCHWVCKASCVRKNRLVNPTFASTLSSATPITDRRRKLVEQAVELWKRQLTDMGGRNNLLAYKDLRLGTLGLSDADTDELEALLAARPTTLGRLFEYPDQRENAIRRGRAIYRKATELLEERGIETLFIAYGFASWEPQGATLLNPCAPVLLRPAKLTPRDAAQTDFELEPTSEFRVSETLLQYLRSEFGVAPASADLDIDGEIDTPREFENVFNWLKSAADHVPGFTLNPRVVLGTFSYMKMPMVVDLTESIGLLAENDLIAAIAGDENAVACVRRSRESVDIDDSEPDDTAPEDEFLVLDADSSQNWAINAVMQGHSLIVRGPPGTGKSQTISNLIAALTARGKRVLFVAEKRAAIEAVVKRLESVGLGDLVFDAHGGIESRQATAKNLADAGDAAREVQDADFSRLTTQLVKTRDELIAATHALHERDDATGMSVFDAMNAALATPTRLQSDARLSSIVLRAVDRDAFNEVEDALEEYVLTGAFELDEDTNPWWAATVTRESDAIDLGEKINALLDMLTRLRDELSVACGATGLPSVDDPDALDEAIALWSDTREFATQVDLAIFDKDLDSLRLSTQAARSGAVSQTWAGLTSGTFRRAKREMREMCTALVSVAEYPRIIDTGIELRDQWKKKAPVKPSVPSNLTEMIDLSASLKDGLATIDEFFADSDIEISNLEFGAMAKRLRALADDRETLRKLPRIEELAAVVESKGFGDVLDFLQGSAPSIEDAVIALKFIWVQSIADDFIRTSPSGSRDPATWDRLVNRFRELDREHISSTPQRIRRRWAQRVALARESNDESAALIDLQSKRKRKLLPFRELFEKTDNYMLDLKPCWIMSPLVVSRLLPAERLFDVVVFDEASQIPPADAIPAIMRGHQLVVAGDEKQLPPTAFFMTSIDDDDVDRGDQFEESDLVGAEGSESILEALDHLLPWRYLQWHYRSRDERLIAFSNARFYDNHLVTFPGTGVLEPVRHVLVPFTVSSAQPEDSPSDEVNEVVQLILDHAQTSPERSLGVIAMGIKHSERIEHALYQALAGRDDLEEFFSRSAEEPFFVKNLERVQGDERDSIILSVGYGKTQDGRMQYRFGPLNGAGGGRRLNVAATRARQQLTLVSSFSSAEMDPKKSGGAGLLRDYLVYAESGGTALGEAALPTPELNPFEIQVRDALVARGVNVTPQLGVAGYVIDFAIHHPDQPGRYVLAIECDGRTYHSTPTARDRDRLRQQQLENLGWRFHRIWSTSWFSAPEKATERALEVIDAAIKAVNRDASGDSMAIAPAVTLLNPEREPSQLVAAKGVRKARPPIAVGRPIDAYAKADIVKIALWICSDTRLRTEEELLVDVMDELGFKRRGKKIVATITQAISSPNVVKARQGGSV
jgi:very-short-patch-repair endonuclease